MTKNTFQTRYSTATGSITFISALTEPASQRSEYEAHAHYGEFEIYHFTEGDIYFSFEGKHYQILPGTMVVIAPGTLHRPIIKSPCRYSRKRILLKKEIFAEINSAMSLSSILRKKKIIVIPDESVKNLNLDKLFEQVGLYLSQRTEYDDFCAMVSVVSFLINAEKFSRKNSENLLVSKNRKSDEIVRFIEKNLSENLSYKTIAENFYISEKNLYKIFKKETGFTLSDYITERRIIKAQSILNAGDSATQAATLSGFNDYSVFYRNFLRKVGVSPTRYAENLIDDK